MIHFFAGTVFNRESEVDAIVNTVNCLGVMGAGIALEFMLRYPEMYLDYKVKCDRSQIKIGMCNYYKVANQKTIINFPTKNHFKYPSQMSWIEQGLLNFVSTYQEHGITSVAFPRLGTNKGGIVWNEVKFLMEKHLGRLDIDVYICEDKLQVAEGIEKSMLEAFHSIELTHLSQLVKLSDKQINYITNNKPYDRFWKIGETNSIGLKTYQELFNFFYRNAIQPQTQLNHTIDDKGMEQSELF